MRAISSRISPDASGAILKEGQKASGIIRNSRSRKWISAYILYVGMIFFPSIVISQKLFAPMGGGEVRSENIIPCLSEDDRMEIKSQLNNNIENLKAQKIIKTHESAEPITFGWPLRKTADLDFNSYYGTNNFVDHDPSAGLLDYNCDTRTYNGHRGTDFDTWPFPWYIYENDMVEVVAANAGIIIGKTDGNEDNHCSCSGSWNAVFIQHSDGSQTWYGHLKKFSLTSKGIGESVASGEYLGVVASSGCSTQPHLHFEVYDGLGNLIDPYQGPCNSLNSFSWWNSQRQYREPTLNALLTHSSTPIHGCPSSNEAIRLSDVFPMGNPVYMAIYFHDETVGDSTQLRIKRPDGSVWITWKHIAPDTYNKSWWWWLWYLPNDAPTGTWTVEADFMNETFTKEFDYVHLCLVTNSNESGSGSLRAAISCANDGDTIFFDDQELSYTIHLDSSLIISKDLTIMAISGQYVSIDGNKINNVIDILSGASVNLIGIDIWGNTNTDGVLRSMGNLKMNKVHIYGFGSVGSVFINDGILQLDTLVTISSHPQIIDYEGNRYPVIQIDTQWWMRQNLRTTKYRDGNYIPNGADEDFWSMTSSAAYCWYGDDSLSNFAKYGALYNQYTVSDTNSRKICPVGWHVPTKWEWEDLIDNLGGEPIAGGKMKTIGTIQEGTGLWQQPNTGATNESGFSGLPGGYRVGDGTFTADGFEGAFWSSYSVNQEEGWSIILSFINTLSDRDYNPKNRGFSVRCVKD